MLGLKYLANWTPSESNLVKPQQGGQKILRKRVISWVKRRSLALSPSLLARAYNVLRRKLAVERALLTLPVLFHDL